MGVSDTTSSLRVTGNLTLGFLRPIEFRPIKSVEELRAALGLVYQEYLQRNYLKPNPAQLKLSIYNALTSSTTFIAKHAQLGVVGTISLIQDSPLGLPMDEIYKAELDELRRHGEHLAEASMLALNSGLFGRKVFTLFHPKKMFLTLRLFKAMFDYLRYRTTVDELVACFNPKHQSLYDLLQLQPLGRLKWYSSANGNPAIARHFTVRTLEEQAGANPVLRFMQTKPRRVLEGYTLSAEDLQELFVRSTSVFQSASHTELESVKACYPTYDFDRILSATSLTPNENPVS